MDSLYLVAPPPEEVATDGLEGTTLVLHEEDLELGGEFFAWSHPTNPSKALFMVDDATERAVWDGASRSYC